MAAFYGSAFIHTHGKRLPDSNEYVTHESYAALVSRLESVAATHPTRYRLRVGALAVLGYACVAAMMLGLLAFLPLLTWALIKLDLEAILFKLALPVLVLVATLGRALWVTLVPPPGLEIRADAAPVLFAEIDAVRRAVNAPAPHHVLISDRLNASVAQVPRLGILGWQQTYLVLGLPLLTALTPAQFRAVLAHEFGHLSRAHTRFGNWIYRIRGTWAQVVVAVQQRRSRLGTLLISRFVRWYSPLFDAYTFVLARRHEFEADRIAAAAVGSATMASTLVSLALRTRYLNDVVWPRVSARTVDEPVPPPAAFVGVVHAAPAELPPSMTRTWLAGALASQSDLEDPHPSLSARLAALDLDPSDDPTASTSVELLAQPIAWESTAAAHYLGQTAITLADALDARWRQEVTARWKDRHRHLVRARDGLRELEARATQAPLDLEERFHVADWTEDVYGADAALPLVTALVHDAPRHASGCFMLGRLLLARNEESGIAYLERAMQIDPGATGMAAAMIAGYLRNVGRVQEASAFQAEADVVIAAAEAADAERRRVGPGDHFVPADVQDSDRARLIEQLARSSTVGRAWLVRKVTRHAAERPCYVLGIARAEPWWRFVSDGSNTYLVRKLVEELDLPGGTIVFVLTRKRRWLRRALRRVSGAEVYRRRNR